ncbi:MAG: porin [Janthinobacterium lividum]
MKKLKWASALRVTPLVASLATLAAGSAHAQSSVTLYGVIDAGVAYVHNAQGTGGRNDSTLVRFSSGNTFGSRWGLKGTEDLGGGLAAVFQIENGFNDGTGTLGQGSREFGRKSVVGLASRQLGTVTLGRQYDPVVDLVQTYTEDAYFGGSFASPGDLDNYDNSVRVSNSVKYVSPVLYGFQFEALYGLGGVAGSTGAGQTYGFGGSYASGPLGAAVAFFHANGGSTTANDVRTWTSSSDSLFNTVINQGFASAKSIQIVRAGTQYVAGPFTVGAAYSNTQYSRDGFSVFSKTAKFNNGSVFVNCQLTPALRVGGGYNYTKLSGPASAKYNQFNLGTDYALSKRTTLYALAAYQKASGTTLNSSGATVQAEASIGSYGVNSGTNSQALAVVGMRHKF